MQADKRRTRRIIFKGDEWYAGAALSIGITGRQKGGARPSPVFIPVAEEKSD
jgi:hypothetical protein